jgi:DNA helicase-2/ATP-dependent DNA helicase PcrA
MNNIQTIILGPPGTGKTTKCLSIIEQEFANGIRPEQILYTTFTKKGASEAILRACEKFKFKRQQLPYFRTIHSLAFQEMRISREDIMQFRDYKRIGESLGLVFGYTDLSEGMAAPSANIGDQMLYTLGLARARRVEYETQFNELDFDFSWFEFKRFLDTLDSYKSKNGLMDFSDLLDQYIAVGVPLGIKVAVIDEAQDLSKQQWDVIKIATANVERKYIAGDDDQAIFRWSGADVETFLNLEGGQLVLGQSHRLPCEIWHYANQISSRIEHRYEKEWVPRDDGGTVVFHNTVDDIEIHDGSTMMLARNKYLLKRYEEFLRREGYPYMTQHGSSIDPQLVSAIRSWEALRAGKAVDVSFIRAAYQYLKVGVGVARGKKSLHGASGELTIQQLKEDWGLLTDAIWHDALIELPDVEYYLAALRRGSKLDKDPNILVSTIHTIKGGEADNVIIISDVSWKCYNAIGDDEHRTFYVAVTRAKNTLQIVLPQGQSHYDFP